MDIFMDAASYPLPCTIHVAMLRAEAAWKQELRAQTVAGLVTVLRNTLSTRQVEMATSWLRENIRR